jgi:AcrR family transcriptional regulator
MNVEARTYSSPLRKQQSNATRRRIVETAMRLVAENSQPLTHEAVATRSQVAARTVYRHFPTRNDLVQAMWELLKEQTATEFPRSGAAVPRMAAQIYRNFDRNEALVKAFLASGAGAEVRDRGAVEGRPAMRRSLEQHLDGLSPRRKSQAVAVFLALYSAPAWQLMRERGGLSGAEAAHAVEWAMSSLLDALTNEQRKEAHDKRSDQSSRNR